MTTVFVFVSEDRYIAPEVFSSKKAILAYFQQLYPHAKHLRITFPSYVGGTLQILNHNSHLDAWGDGIYEVEIDKEIDNE